jgi:hypothetical protein
MNAAEIAAKLTKLWCGWFHGGGHIMRDSQDRLNWRCAKCGRWGDDPVSHEEAAVTVARYEADMRRAILQAKEPTDERGIGSDRSRRAQEMTIAAQSLTCHTTHPNKGNDNATQ